MKSDGLVKVTGEVEQVSSDEITLYVTNSYSRDLPRHGFLSIDNEASARALERQRTALEAVKFNRAVRSDLGLLLIVREEAVQSGVRRLDGV